MSTIRRVVAYVDGFNLYYGIRKEGRRYLWLDVEGLVKRLLKQDQRLVGVQYFTASVRNDPPSVQRQKLYLKALAAHSATLAGPAGGFVILGSCPQDQSRTRSWSRSTSSSPPSVIRRTRDLRI